MCERVENPSMNSNRIPMEKFKTTLMERYARIVL